MSPSAVSNAYLAGILDGEGCIHAKSGTAKGRLCLVPYYARVQVGNTNKALIDWLLDTYGGRVGLAHRNNHSKRDLWTWFVSTQKDIIVLLEAAIPYMVVKPDQACWAVDLARRPCKEEQQRLYTLIREAKK